MIIASTGLIGSASFAWATPAQDIGKGLRDSSSAAGYSNTPVDIGVMIGKLIGTALSYIGVLLLCYLLYAGFLWMTAGGDSKKVDQAKLMIKNAIIGMIIIGIAYTASSFIMTTIGSAIDGSNVPAANPTPASAPAAG